MMAQLFFVSDYVGLRNFVFNSWTLSVELGWYILFAALFLLELNRRHLLIGAATAGVVVAGAIFDKAAYHIPLGRLCMIATCIVGLLTFRIVEAKSRSARSGLAILTAAIVLALVLGFGVSKYEGKLQYTLQGILVSWSLGYVLFFTSFRLNLPDFIQSLLEGLGKISYSAYLMHTFAIMAISNFEISGISYIGCVVLASILLSIPTYLFVEKPAVRYAHNRWGRATNGATDSATS
jgi:peptidoglycan/LPS O-acetylase OafA/YrhL